MSLQLWDVHSSVLLNAHPDHLPEHERSSAELRAVVQLHLAELATSY